MSAAQKEAHDKVAARKEQARAAAVAAMDTVNKEIQSVSDSATKSWSAARAKIASDMNSLKADVANMKHDHDVNRAAKRADRAEQEASFAVDYAIASVEQAKLAILDAIDSRLAAEEAKSA